MALARQHVVHLHPEPKPILVDIVGGKVEVRQSTWLGVIGAKVMERALQRRFPALQPRIDDHDESAGFYLLQFNHRGATGFIRLYRQSTLADISTALLNRAYGG